MFVRKFFHTLNKINLAWFLLHFIVFINKDLKGVSTKNLDLCFSCLYYPKIFTSTYMLILNKVWMYIEARSFHVIFFSFPALRNRWSRYITVLSTFTYEIARTVSKLFLECALSYWPPVLCLQLLLSVFSFNQNSAIKHALHFPEELVQLCWCSSSSV